MVAIVVSVVSQYTVYSPIWQHDQHILIIHNCYSVRKITFIKPQNVVNEFSIVIPLKCNTYNASICIDFIRNE